MNGHQDSQLYGNIICLFVIVSELLLNQRSAWVRLQGMEQALARGRAVISSLKRQRQELILFMENKEQELLAALSRHKKENSLLRNKLLAYLHDKKLSLSDSKCENPRLVAVLEGLLCMQLNREHFMALDLAKQNKVRYHTQGITTKFQPLLCFPYIVLWHISSDL